MERGAMRDLEAIQQGLEGGRRGGLGKLKKTEREEKIFTEEV